MTTPDEAGLLEVPCKDVTRSPKSATWPSIESGLADSVNGVFPKPGKSTRTTLWVWGKEDTSGKKVSVEPPNPCRQIRSGPEGLPPCK